MGGKKRWRIAIAAGAAIALAASACGGSDDDPVEEASPAADDPTDDATDDAGQGDGSESPETEGEPVDVEPMNLQVSANIGGPETYHNVAIQAWLDEIESRSNGAITSEFFYAGELVGPAELAPALDNSVADVAHLIMAYTPDAFPIDAWFLDVTTANTTSGAPSLVMESAAASMEWWLSNEDLMQQTFMEQGIFPLTPGFSPAPDYDLICNDPYTSLEDLRGKAVRTALPGHVSAAEAIGMEPVSMTGTEMYEALQRGVVDCIMTPTPEIVSSDLWTAGDEWTEGNFVGASSYCFCMSLDTWESMSVEQQDILWDSLPVYMETLLTEVLNRYQRFFTEAEEMGVTLNEPDEELREAIDTHNADVVEQARAEAPEEVADADAAVDSFLSLQDKWASFLTEDLGYGSVDSWREWGTSGSTDVDVAPFVDQFWDEVLAPRSPS